MQPIRSAKLKHSVKLFSWKNTPRVLAPVHQGDLDDHDDDHHHGLADHDDEYHDGDHGEHLVKLF